MTNDDSARRGPLSADVEWKVVSAAATYPKTATGAVEYLPVRRDDGTVLGYVWRSLEGEAIAFQRRDIPDDDAYNTATAWSTRLKGAKARGLSADEALSEAIEEAPAGLGRIDSAAAARADDLDALRALAKR